MICELFEKCPFYNEKMPGEWGPGAMLRMKYCESDKSACARYIVAKMAGREHVPADLFPTRTEIAEQIIQKVQSEKNQINK